jgi:IK cytokine
LDYALLNKVRSEIVKKPDGEDGDGGKTSAPKEDQRVTFRTIAAKVCNFVLNFADEEQVLGCS